MHDATTKAFPACQTKIKLIAFSSAYAAGQLEGKETEYLTDWMEAADLEKAGVIKLTDVTKPGEWLATFHELEDKLPAKQRKLKVYSF